MLCLHCSPPTSDPRGTRAEGTEPFAHRHRLDPRGLQRLSGNRRPPAGQPPKSHRRQPSIPGDPRTETPAQLAQPPRRSKRARNDRTTHTSRITRRVRSSPPPAEQRTTRRGTARHTRQPATTAPPETPAATLHYLTIYGEVPPVLSRDPPSPPDGQTERVYSWDFGPPQNTVAQN